MKIIINNVKNQYPIEVHGVCNIRVFIYWIDFKISINLNDSLLKYRSTPLTNGYLFNHLLRTFDHNNPDLGDAVFFAIFLVVKDH